MEQREHSVRLGRQKKCLLQLVKEKYADYCSQGWFFIYHLPHLLAQVGVIGECNRDGNRHSRVLKLDPEGYEVSTMDHDNGELRRDLKHSWRETEAPKPLLPPEDELLCDPNAGAGDELLCDPNAPL